MLLVFFLLLFLLHSYVIIPHLYCCWWHYAISCSKIKRSEYNGFSSGFEVFYGRSAWSNYFLSLLFFSLGYAWFCSFRGFQLISNAQSSWGSLFSCCFLLHVYFFLFFIWAFLEFGGFLTLLFSISSFISSFLVLAACKIIQAKASLQSRSFNKRSQWMYIYTGKVP